MNRRDFINRASFISTGIAIAPSIALTKPQEKNSIDHAYIYELERRLEYDELHTEYKDVKIDIYIEKYIDECDLRNVIAIANTKHGRWFLYSKCTDMFYRACCLPKVDEWFGCECYWSFTLNNKDLDWA